MNEKWCGSQRKRDDGGYETCSLLWKHEGDHHYAVSGSLTSAVDAAEPFRQPTRAEYESLHSRVETLTKERNTLLHEFRECAECNPQSPTCDRQARLEKERDTLAAEAVGLREAALQAATLFDGMVLNGKLDQHECRNTFQRLKKALSSSPSTSDWSAAFEALVKEHRERRIGQFGVHLSSEMLRHKELSDAAERALAEVRP